MSNNVLFTKPSEVNKIKFSWNKNSDSMIGTDWTYDEAGITYNNVGYYYDGRVPVLLQNDAVFTKESVSNNVLFTKEII